MIAMYGLANCDTCRKARAWLDAHQVAYRFTDYREAPIDDDELTGYAGQLGWEKLVNRASPTWRRLPEADRTPASTDEWLALVRANPTLIRRPLLVVTDGTAHVGFSASGYAALFAS